MPMYIIFFGWVVGLFTLLYWYARGESDVVNQCKTNMNEEEIQQIREQAMRAEARITGSRVENYIMQF